MTEKINAVVPQAHLSIKSEHTMYVSHFGDVVKSMSILALSASAQFITIMATVMYYLGRGKREV